jgi:hypothetical protein
MDVMSVDSNRLGESDDAASAHSLRSLVSSDDSIRSLERHDGIPTTIDCQLDKNCGDWRHCHIKRNSSTEISIIACSSPEIKALVQPLSPSIPFQQQRSWDTLSFFPDKYHGDESYHSSPIPATKMKDRSFSVVSSAASPRNGRTSVNGNIRLDDLSIEHRDQENCQDGDRCVYSDRSISMRGNSLYDGETDELALSLERQSIGSNRSYLPGVANEELRNSSQGPMVLNTMTNTIQQHAIHGKPTRRHQERPKVRRSSLHRRISHDSLPEISKILCEPDFPSA